MDDDGLIDTQIGAFKEKKTFQKIFTVLGFNFIMEKSWGSTFFSDHYPHSGECVFQIRGMGCDSFELAFILFPLISGIIACKMQSEGGQNLPTDNICG